MGSVDIVVVVGYLYLTYIDVMGVLFGRRLSEQSNLRMTLEIVVRC